MLGDQALSRSRSGQRFDGDQVARHHRLDERCTWIDACGHDTAEHVTLGEDADELVAIDDDQRADAQAGS